VFLLVAQLPALLAPAHRGWPLAEPDLSEGWTFFQGFDSTGNDICCSRYANSPEALAREAAATDKCVAFNTNGFFKQAVIPKPNWVKWTSDPRKGLYVQNSYLPQVPGELPAIGEPLAAPRAQVAPGPPSRRRGASAQGLPR
jgi:hypothetical protein